MKESMEEMINTIVESMKSLNRQAFSVYKPIVDEICSGRAVEEKELENVLDGLVSVCMSDEMLDLFKRVCRKFYYQYPEIITDYVMFYKEIYEEQEGVMSYDIYLKDPVTGKTAEVPGHLMHGGTYRADYHPESGTFTPALNTEASLNITYNYGHYYYEIYEEDGIWNIYGVSGFDSILMLEKMITLLNEKYKKGEWFRTKRNKAIYYDENGNEIEGIIAIVNKTMPARKEVSIETKTGI